MADNPVDIAEEAHIQERIKGERARYFVATFPDLCRELRRMLGLKLTDLASAVDISFISICNYEMGKRLPKPAVAMRYVSYLLAESKKAGFNVEEVKLRVLSRRPFMQGYRGAEGIEQHDGTGPVAVLRAASAHKKDTPNNTTGRGSDTPAASKQEGNPNARTEP